MPVVRAVTGRDLINVEEKMFRIDDARDLSRFLGLAANVLRFDGAGLDDMSCDMTLNLSL